MFYIFESENGRSCNDIMLQERYNFIMICKNIKIVS